MEEESKQKPIDEQLCEQLESELKSILDEKVQPENIDYLYRLYDVYKDIDEKKYYKMKEEIMRRGYIRGQYNDGTYSNGGYGAYSEGGSYGRRGVPGTGRGRYREGGNYHGEDMLDEMNYHYGRYHDSYNTGNYGAKEDSAKKMTDAFVEFGYSIAEELDPNEKMMFKQAMQEIMQELDK